MHDITHDRGHIRDSARRHGLAVAAVAGLAFVICLANFALGHVGAGVAAVIAGLLAFGAGMAWLAMDGRRVRQAEPRLGLRSAPTTGPTMGRARRPNP